MALTTKSENPRDWAFLLSEGEGNISREVVTIQSGAGVLKAGTVLGEIVANRGAVTVGAAVFTGTGNGTFAPASPAYSAAVQEGTYLVRLLEAAANGGNFEVIRPDGTIDGIAAVGTAYDGQIKFTIGDGATDFSNAAQFAVPVTIDDPTDVGSFKASPATATDGSDIAKAVLAQEVDATSAAVKAVVIRRLAEVKTDMLVFAASVNDATKKATKRAQLAAQFIIAR